jgi:hypothetical protein
MTLQHIALTSKTPVRLFFQADRGGRGDAPSGDALRVEDQPLIDKVQSKQKRYGNSWYSVVRLVAKAIMNDPNLTLPPGEVIWQDVQADYRTALLEDAVQMRKVGIPYPFVIKRLGLTPEEVEELELLGEDKLDPESVSQTLSDPAQLAVQKDMAEAAASQPDPEPDEESESE